MIDWLSGLQSTRMRGNIGLQYRRPRRCSLCCRSKGPSGTVSSLRTIAMRASIGRHLSLLVGPPAEMGRRVLFCPGPVEPVDFPQRQNQALLGVDERAVCVRLPLLAPDH